MVAKGGDAEGKLTRYVYLNQREILEEGAREQRNLGVFTYLAEGRGGPRRGAHDSSATDCTVTNFDATRKDELEWELEIEQESMFSTSTRIE